MYSNKTTKVYCNPVDRSSSSIYTRMNGHCLYLQTTVNVDYKKQCKQIIFNIDSVEKHNLPYGDMDWNPKGSTESLQMIAKIKVF